MNFKTTLVLLVLVVLGVVVVLIAPPKKPTAEDAGGMPTPVSEQQDVFDPQPQTNDLVRVQVERPDEPRWVFERSPKADGTSGMESWQMLEPLTTPTESHLVDSLARTFGSLRSRSSFRPGQGGAVSLSDAGLEPPTATVTLVDKEGKEYKLEVGKRAAMSKDTYVRVAGRETIHIAGRDLVEELKKEIKDFRAKNVVRLTANEAVRIEVQHEGKTYDLSRGDDREWVLNAPVRAYAEGEKIRSLLNRFSGARVVEFVEDEPDSLASFGLDAPTLSVKVTTETKRELPAEPNEGEEPATQPVEPKYETVTKTYGLAIGGYADMKSENHFAKLLDQPWVFTIAESTAKELIPDLAEWRDPRITRVKALDATRVELIVGDDSATLEKVNGRWQGSGDLAELESPAVTDLLEAFEDVRAIDYVDEPEGPSKYGLDAPRAIVKVTGSGAVAPLALRIGANTRSGLNTYVQVEGQPAVMVISAKQAERLAVTPLSLRSREIFAAQPQRIREIELTRASGRYTLVKEGGDWKITTPVEAPPDAAAVRDLTNDLARLRARQVVARGDGAAYGLDEPAVVVRFTLEEPPPMPTTTQASQPAAEPVLVEHTLQVGRKNNVTYCRKDDDPYVFELDGTLYPVLVAELIQRSLFAFGADDVTSLAIVAPGGTLEFGKQDDEWRYLRDLTVKLSQKKLKDFVGDLARLRVERYLAYGTGDLDAAGLAKAPVTVTIQLADGGPVTLKIDQVQRGELPRKAAWVEAGHVFLLRHAEAEKLMRGLDHYVKPEVGTPKVGDERE